MFKISRKVAIIRASIIGVLVAAITATGLFFANKTEESKAITPEGAAITIEVDDWIYYDGDKFTGNYYLYLNGVRVTAFCAQPALDNPTGPNTAHRLSNTDPNINLIKLLMFLMFNDNARTSAARTAFYAPFSTEHDLQYAWTHAIIGAIYDNDYTGLSEENVVKVNNAITTLRDYYNSNSDLWLMAKNYQVFKAPGAAGIQDVVWLEDNTQYGTINVQKCDSTGPTSGACNPQGGASLEGIEFTVYNNSGRFYNKNNDTFYNNGDTIASGRTNASGQISFTSLPANNITYRVKETATNSSYQLTAAEQNVNLNGGGSSQNPRFYNTVNTGSITVKKSNSVTGGCSNVGDASLSGTEFQLINNNNNAVGGVGKGGVISQLPINSSCSVTFSNIPYGSYIIKEVIVGTGYSINTAQQNVTIPTNGQTSITLDFANTPIYGDITVSKVDSSTQNSTTVGDATFNGTQFQLINNSANSVYYGGRYVASGSVVDTKTLSGGATSVKFEGLPFGRYQVKEVAVGTGYNVNVTPQNVSINASNLHPAATFTNTAILGDVTVYKNDNNLYEGVDQCIPVGDATFNGTTFRIINRSTNPIYYNNQAVAVGAVIDSKTLTDNACNVKFENLPYGRYDVEETSASTGYNMNTNIQRVTIPTSGDIHTHTVFVNTPIYGNLTIHKEDAETKDCVALKHLSFVGTTYQIINRSKNPVYYNDTLIPVGSIITTKTFTGDPCNGGLLVDPLPYGTYEIKETAVSEGYVLNTTPNTERINDDDLHPETTIVNQGIRGDVTFVKTDPTNNRPMRDVIFTISRVNDDDVLEETHILMTDENGVLDTRSSFNLHSYQTNRYDALYEEPDPLQYSGFGTWYGYDNLDRRLPVNDSLGALPYGRYVIQELKCGANLFCYEVINEKATITINQHNQVIDLGDWDNNCAKLSMDTEAVDAEDDDHFIEIKTDKPQAKILDRIDYCIKPKFKVTIKGILMDKQTGEPLLINGQTIENSVDVMLEEGEECGSTEMVFDIPDITALGGHELVTFQTMWYKDDIVLRHEDIDDESQTVEIVSLTTYATNKDTNDKFLPYDQQTTVRDIVKYCVKPGLEYVIKGIVMNKETQSPLLINGETVEQEITFTPENACGELDMFYDIDTTGLAGARLVIFESLYRDDELIIDHKDFNNPDESFEVEIPAPDTGVFTGSEQSGSAVNIALVIFVVSTAGVTVYGVSRVCARKSFLKRK